MSFYEKLKSSCDKSLFSYKRINPGEYEINYNNDEIIMTFITCVYSGIELVEIITNKKNMLQFMSIDLENNNCENYDENDNNDNCKMIMTIELYADKAEILYQKLIAIFNHQNILNDNNQ